jgi:hypothetical protein
MIDTIYQIVKVVLNKELRGNITPDEFNKIAKQVQDEIFAEYFVDANLQQNKENRGLTNKNYANLPQLVRQKIARFHKLESLTYNVGTLNFDLPSDIYFIEDNGLLYNSNVIEEAQGADFGFLSSSLASPSVTFPVYENYMDAIRVYPAEIQTGVTCRYLRKPADPKWTYTSVGDVELFDATISDYQDFELHTSELSNIVINMLSYFGINIREAEVTQYAEALKQNEENKEQQ